MSAGLSDVTGTTWLEWVGLLSLCVGSQQPGEVWFDVACAEFRCSGCEV